MGNPFCYCELTTADLGPAQEFYQKVFDWKLTPFEGAGRPYMMVDPGQEPMGGLMEMKDAAVPKMWCVYIQVDDVDQACAKVTAAGGVIHLGKSPVPGFGFFACAADPQGAIFGLWENLEK